VIKLDFVDVFPLGAPLDSGTWQVVSRCGRCGNGAAQLFGSLVQPVPIWQQPSQFCNRSGSRISNLIDIWDVPLARLSNHGACRPAKALGTLALFPYLRRKPNWPSIQASHVLTA
jgi:hypothetical protein